MASMVAQTVKNLPAMPATQVPSLGQQDPLRREWLPTLVLLPGESHGQRSLVGYSPWGRTEWDPQMTNFHFHAAWSGLKTDK